MSGQRKNYSVHEKQTMEYVRKYPPYGPYETLDLDLRSFSQYCKEKNISNKDVTPKIVEEYKLREEKV